MQPGNREAARCDPYLDPPTRQVHVSILGRIICGINTTSPSPQWPVNMKLSWKKQLCPYKVHPPIDGQMRKYLDKAFRSLTLTTHSLDKENKAKEMK